MKLFMSMLGWIALFALSLSIGWYVSRPAQPLESYNASDALAKAKPLYVTHCARCHGAQGHGDPAMMIALQPPPRDFRDRPWKNPITAAAVRRVIISGIPGSAMTPYRGLISDQQADLLSAYVLHLSETKATNVTSTLKPNSIITAAEDSPFQWHPSPQPLPDAQLVAADGQRLNLTEIAQQPLLIHFWGTTCVHCLAEMVQMQNKDLADDSPALPIISICVDSTQASEATELVQRFAPGHIVYVDPLGLVGQKFGVSALPAYRVVNAGKVLGSHVGTLPWKEIDLQSIRKRASQEWIPQ
jgi:mono/diheme cytochrome c family protein